MKIINIRSRTEQRFSNKQSHQKDPKSAGVLKHSAKNTFYPKEEGLGFSYNSNYEELKNFDKIIFYDINDIKSFKHKAFTNFLENNLIELYYEIYTKIYDYLKNNKVKKLLKKLTRFRSGEKNSEWVIELIKKRWSEFDCSNENLKNIGHSRLNVKGTKMDAKFWEIEKRMRLFFYLDDKERTLHLILLDPFHLVMPDEKFKKENSARLINESDHKEIFDDLIFKI